MVREVCLAAQIAFAIAALACLFALGGRFAVELAALSLFAWGVRLGYGMGGE